MNNKFSFNINIICMILWALIIVGTLAGGEVTKTDYIVSCLCLVLHHAVEAIDIYFNDKK